MIRRTIVVAAALLLAGCIYFARAQSSSKARLEAFAKLRHDGDFTAAAKDLRAQGYGDQPRAGQSSNGTAHAAAIGPRIAAEPIQDDDESNDDVSDRWPDAIDDAAFHGPAGEFVRRAEPHTEADRSAMLVQFLTAAGNAMNARNRKGRSESIAFSIAETVSVCKSTFPSSYGSCNHSQNGKERELHANRRTHHPSIS